MVCFCFKTTYTVHLNPFFHFMGENIIEISKKVAVHYILVDNLRKLYWIRLSQVYNLKQSGVWQWSSIYVVYIQVHVFLFHLNQFGHFKDREILLKDNFAHTLPHTQYYSFWIPNTQWITMNVLQNTLGFE